MESKSADTTKQTIISAAYGEKDLEKMLTERVVQENQAFIAAVRKRSVQRRQWNATIIGLFSLTASMMFKLVLAMMSEHFDICTTLTKETVDIRCKMDPENYSLMGHLITILAFLIGLQIGGSCALIWRAYRNGPSHMPSHLIDCIMWTNIHSVAVLVYMLAIQEATFVHMMSYLAVFVFGMNALGISILIAFHLGMIYTRCCKKEPGSIIVSEKIVITV